MKSEFLEQEEYSRAVADERQEIGERATYDYHTTVDIQTFQSCKPKNGLIFGVCLQMHIYNSHRVDCNDLP